MELPPPATPRPQELQVQGHAQKRELSDMRQCSVYHVYWKPNRIHVRRWTGLEPPLVRHPRPPEPRSPNKPTYPTADRAKSCNNRRDMDTCLEINRGNRCEWIR